MKKMIWRYSLFFILSLFIILYFPSHAFAGTQNIKNFILPPALGVLFLIVYFFRKYSIGGLLLLYYVQLYPSCLVPYIKIAFNLKDLVPSNWDDNKLYFLYLMSTVPFLLAKTGELVFASKLLIKRHRTKKYVKTLEYILLTATVLSSIDLIITTIYWNDQISILIRIGTFMLSMIWYLYFVHSMRVQIVLVEGKLWRYFLIS